MQFGCCIGAWSLQNPAGADAQAALAGLLEQMAILFDVGFSFAELSVSSLMSLSDNEYDAVRTALAFAPLPIFACNSFVPASLPIVGPNTDRSALQAHVAKAIYRVEGIGAQRIVFGSGGARSIPDGFSRDQAYAQLTEFLEICQREAEPTDVLIVIEPLRQAESNVLNTVTEAAMWVERAGLSHVRLLADTYHMHAQEEPLTVLSQVASLLAHVHVANKEERRYPGFLATDRDDMRSLLAILDAAGYDQGISVECRFDDLAAQAPLALACLMQAAIR